MNQSNERADDAVELVIQLLVLSDVAEHRGNLETRQRLARGAEGGVVARVAILAATVLTLPEIKRDGRASPP